MIRHPRLATWFVLSVLFFVSLACGPTTQPSPFPTNPMTLAIELTAEAQPIPTSEPTQPPASQPTSLPTNMPTRVVADGGWLLFSSSTDGVTIDSLWLASADGSQVRPLVTGQAIVVPWDWNLSQAVSPDGRYLAFITTSDYATLHGLTLQLVSLPDGAATIVTRLTSDQTEPRSEQPMDDPNVEIVRALTEVNSLAWSPDGQQLAFMGAMSGPSSDLYVYSLSDGSIRQLTNGPSQGIRPLWSPDGQWIIHAGVSSLGSGAGYSMEGVWAAAADGSEVKTLYTPTGGDEQWVGWMTSQALLVYTWRPSCGPMELRQIDIVTGEVTSLWDQCFTDVAYDPASGATLLVVDEYIAEWNEDQSAGVFRMNVGELGAVSLWDGPAYDVWWDANASLFFARISEGALLAITPAGEVRRLSGPRDARVVVAPDGQTAAWVGFGWNEAAPWGLWVGPLDGEPQQFSDQPFNFAAWSLDGSHLLVLDESALYVATPPDYAPRQVATGFTPRNWQPLWIAP